MAALCYWVRLPACPACGMEGNMANIDKKIYILIVLMMCVLFSACSFGEVKIEEATGSTAEQKIYISPTRSPSSGAGIVTTSLSLCGQEGIMILTASYYSAMETKDVSALMTLVSNPDLIDENYFENFGNITDVNVKHVYTMDGTGTVETIAYVYYEVTVEGIETPVPSLDELYISNDNGTYYIFNGKLPTSEYNELVSLASADGVTQLAESVNRAFLNALDSDEALKEYVNNRGVSG